MRFAVRLTADAIADLEEIHDWTARHDSVQRAAHVQDGMLAETFFKPYRIIYAAKAPSVDIYLIADGRRDMQTLLARRLLAGET